MSGPGTVVVGMSGGVDSSVAAYLLQQQGYRVVGLFMKNWDDTDCHSRWDYEDVAAVCAQLGISYYAVDFTVQYRERVFAKFVEAYQRGWTPNPDVLCNREIKFDVFANYAKRFGADFIATGHYCRLDDGRLRRGIDPHKDQSYFLQAVGRDQLRNVLFPLGHLHKQEVREMADRLGLATARKKDSTGICFIGKQDMRVFLARYLAEAPGRVETLSGEVVGQHTGCWGYTTGQRRHLGLGGAGPPWYVVDKDPQRRRVMVARGREHPHLFRDELELCDVVWRERVLDHQTVLGQIRHRGAAVTCHAVPLGSDRVRLRFAAPQWAAALGQGVALYHDDVCVGGGTISWLGPSRWELATGNGCAAQSISDVIESGN